MSTNGTLVVTDLDTTDATVVAQLNTAGSYGRFSINASGAWTYTTDDAVNELNAGQAVQEVFTVATSDGGSATVTINITGTEDVSTLTSETKNLVESDAVLSTGGTLVLADLDATDATVVAQANEQGTYGKFTIGTDGVWTYVTDDAVNELNAGELVTETFNIMTSDGGTATVIVNITGTNDAAVVTSATVALDEADAPVSTSGTLTSTDVDNLDNVFTASTTTGTYGDFAIDANGDWTFTANDAFNELNVGDSHTETFNVTSVDGTPSTVQITINGTNDAATVSSASVALVETDAPVSTSGVLTSNDVDNSNNAFTASSTVGTYGDFAIDANGGWTFTANSAFDELNVGDNVTETFNVTSVDGTASTVQITINGTNDAATVSSAAVVLTETDLAADVSTTGTLTSTDVDNDDNTFIASNTVGTYGTFVMDTAGAWTFTANSAFDELNVGDSHTETFNVTSVDGTPSTVQITINGTNDAATVSTAAVVLAETDAPLSTNGTLTSSDVDNTDNLFTVSTTVGTYGSFEINEAGAWTYLANSAFNELNVGESHTETFNVTSVDGTASTVQITINGTNDLPVIAASSEISGTVIESGHTDDGTVVPGTNEVTGQLTATDIDNGATQAWTITTATNTHGSFSLTNAATGAWKYELNNTTSDSLKEGETVTETYTVQVADDQGGTASQVVTVTVNGTNDAPQITSADVAIDGTVAESGVVGGVTPSVTGTIVASDVDDDAEQTWTINADNSVVTYGDFTINSDTGAWEYTLDNSLAATQALNAGDTVSQTYIVRVTDDFGAYDDQEVVINITGTNDAPTITSTIEAAKGTVVESGDEDDGTDVVGIITVNGQLTADDVDGSDTPATLDWTPVNTTNNYGTFTLTDTGAWNYALNNASAEVQALKEGDTHEETFAVTVSDGNGGTATQNVTVNITGTNDSPVIDLSHVDSVIAGSVAERGHDASGNLVIGTSTANGKLISTDVDANHTATWSVRNDASITTYGEFAISPANGTWTYTLNNNLAATQALDEGDTVIQTYTVRVTDDFGAYVDQEVTITITGTNDKPSVVEAISAQSGFDADVVDFNAGVYFEDLDTGDTLTFTANGLPAGLTINNATGEITGTIDSSASQYGGSGVHTVVITASDGTASTNQTFTWTVLNPAPVADDDTFAVSEDDAGAQASVVNLLTNDTDPDGDTLTVSAVNGVSANTGIAVTGDGSGVGNGEFIINSDGSYSFDPKGEFEYLAFGETETSTIEYTISDGEGGFDTATLTVTVNGQNDAPVANDDLSITDRNTAKTIDVRGNDTDVDATDLLRVTHIDGQPIATGGSVVLAGQGTVTLNANGTLTFEPDNGFVGQVQIPYTLSDDNNLANSTDTATWTVNVIGVDIVDDASLADANVGENVLSTLDDLDNVTINGQVPVGGTLEGLVITSSAGGASVTLTPAQIAGITINGNGSFTATVDLFDGGLPILADGTLTVTMTANDGTNPSLSSTDTILQDTVTTVTADSLTINDDDDTASLSGTGEVGASIAITVDGAAVPITTVVVDGNGDWFYDFGNDLSDNESITVVATDIYGNTANDGRDVPKLAIADINGAGVDGHITINEAGLDVVGSDAVANSESASGTFTITLNDALDEVQVAGTTISAAALNAATPGAPVVVNAPNGLMTISDYDTGTGVVSYSYELTGPVSHDNGSGNNSFDEALEIRVSDVEGDVRIGTLHVNIVDDIPTVGASEAEVVLAEGGVTVGSAIVGGENLLTNDTQGADGARVHTVTYNDVNGNSTTSAAITDGGNTGALATQYGSLTVHSDGTWSYTSNAASTTTTSVDHATDGLSEQDNFSYNVIDADGDISATSATQEIEVTDTGPAIGAPVASGVDEANLPTGSDQTPLDLIVSGSLAVAKAADSIDTAFTAATTTTLDGLNLKSGGTDIEYVLSNDDHTLIAYSGVGRAEADKVFTVVINNPTASTAGYTFTLQGTLDHAAAAVDLDFGFTVTDSDGDSDTDTFTVTVTDDVPTAVNDTATVAEGSYAAVTGNVIDTGAGEDKEGADGSTITNISFGATDVIPPANNSTTTINGTYGILTIQADGSYSYQRNAGTAGGVNDSFTYTLTDGDGDQDTATLTVSITDAGVVISDVTPLANGGDVIVLESKLGNGTGVGAGSTTANGTFTIASPDGVQELSLTHDGNTYSIALNNVTQGPLPTITTALGNTLAITAYNANTGEVSYTYTLADAETHTSGSGRNDLFENFTINLKDMDSDTSTDTLSVRIVDDIPVITQNVANLAAVSVDETNLTPSIGVNFSGLFSADHGADGAALTDATAYTLAANAASGLFDTATSEPVTLDVNVDGTLITASADGNVVFTIGIVSATGVITLSQLRSVEHADTGDHNDDVSIITSAVSIIATAIDGDGDEVTSTIAIGDRFTFLDDGPSITTATTGPAGLATIVTKDSDLPGSSTANQNFAGAFSVDTSSYGADGDAGTVWDYALTLDNAASGLASGGNPITLVQSGNTITGTADGVTAFTISVNSSTGVVTLTQLLPIDHTADQTDLADFSGDTQSLLASLITLTGTATITDGDGDTSADSETINIGDKFIFEDDGPTIGTPATTDDGEVSEANLSTGSVGSGSLTDSGTLDITNVSADSIDTAFTAATTTTLDGLNLKSGGTDIEYVLSNDDHTLIAYSGVGRAEADKVFTVVINNPTASTAGYTFTLQGTLDHAAASVDLDFGFTVTDSDGDSATDTFTVTVTDDVQALTQSIETNEDLATTVNTSADADGNNTTIFANGAHGSASVNPDGTVTYTPNGNYSGEDTFTYRTLEGGATKDTVVTVTVNPLSDAPIFTVDAPTVATNEDTAVALGLNAPVVTDGVDANGNGAGTGDNPELLSVITLSGIPAGAQLLDGTDSNALLFTGSIGNSGTVTITLDGGASHINGASGTLNLTTAQFNALQVLPPENDHSNFTVTSVVTSYEVDDSGNPIAGVAGVQTSTMVAVTVQAVTDPVTLTLVDGTALTDPDALVDHHTIAEDSTFNLKDLLSASFDDLDGSEVRSIQVSGLPEGTVIGGVTIGNTGAAQVVTINAPGLTTSVTGFPDITITPPLNYSGDLSVGITLNAEDQDSDGPLATGSQESDTVTLNLHVTPIAGDIE